MIREGRDVLFQTMETYLKTAAEDYFFGNIMVLVRLVLVGQMFYEATLSQILKLVVLHLKKE